MYKIYFKQALQILKENPFLSILSIVGTALAICMIMVIVIVYEVHTANYKPETNRDRTLTVKWGTAENKEIQMEANALLSYPTIKACFYPLKSAEAVTAVYPWTSKLAAVPGQSGGFKVDMAYTDAAFWKVFEFNFLDGKPYTEEECQSGIQKAVISESVARKLYGSADVVGKTIELSAIPYTISGVVKDVSKMAEAAYGMVWAPIIETSEVTGYGWCENILGGMRCYILASSSSGFDAIRAEVNNLVAQYNASKNAIHFNLRGQPDTQFTQLTRVAANQDADVAGTIRLYAIIITVLLMVPAFNLSGITLSRMRKRMPEIGVRKAFGATKTELVGQIIYENFIFTLIGGLLGLLFSYIAILLMKDWLISNTLTSLLGGSTTLSAEMLFNPMVFLYAFVFCIVMNLLSAGIPAWRAARKNIVSSLQE